MLPQNDFLKGKVGLIVGIVNAQSIAAGCAAAFHASGARLCLTHQNDKSRRFVDPVATLVDAEFGRGLFRHRVPSRASLGQRHIRAAAPVLRRRYTALWVSRVEPRLHHQRDRTRRI